MKRSIALTAIVVLGGLPVSACGAAHLVSAAAAHSAAKPATTGLASGALDARGLSSVPATTGAPAWLAICGMSVNNTWPPAAAGFGPVITSDASAMKLAQCYFSGSPNRLHPTTRQISGIHGSSSTTPADR